LRAPTEADADAIARLYAERRPLDAEEVRSWFRNPTLDVAADFRVLECNGSLVGYVDVHREGDRLSVDWTARDAASGHALLDWATKRAREQGATRLRAWPWERSGELVDVMVARGFAPVRTSLEMHVSLDGALPEPVWPADVAVRTVREGEEPRVHSLIQEAFADTNDFEPTPYDEWAGWALAPNRFDRNLWFVVLDGGEVVGAAVCEHERTGEPGLGWVESLAVRRTERARGLGKALLLRAFQALRSRGRSAAGLTVDAANRTGAVRLYESVGMHPVREQVTYEQRLA